MLHFRTHLKSIIRSSLNNKWFSNKKEGQPQAQKVFMDEQAIQRKIKQLKQKSQTVSTDDKKRKRTKQFMPTFTIPQVNEKINEFRRQTNTQDLFAFSEITLEQKPTQLQITGYDTDFIQIDNFQYPPSVIITPNQVLNWQVDLPENLKIQHFAILKCINPIPDYIIIGVPDSTVIKTDLRDKLKKIHPNMDILDLFEAISQFNTVVSNDKNCMGFFMSC